MRLALLVAALSLGGCQLYFSGDDEPCATTGGGYVDGYPSNQLRNPETGDCQEFGYGGCDYYDACGTPCPEVGVAYPNWPQCESQCSNLGEEDCLGAEGCQVAYWEDGSVADAPSLTSFRGCYATLDVGAPNAGCWNLDAYGCAQHDECSLFYTSSGPKPLGASDPYPGSATFSRCAPEPTTQGCAAVDCAPGYHCEDSCYPTPGAPDCGPNSGGTMGCGGGTQCTPMCVPDSGYGCAAIDCGPGYECVETCDTTPPTMGGGCFPGECYATCQPTTACETLTDEATCNARGDCTSVYNGDNCTCYPGGYCECEILTWDRCESLGVVPMPL